MPDGGLRAAAALAALALTGSALPLAAAAQDCCRVLEMKLEKTIAKVDVLTLEYVADDVTAATAEALIGLAVEEGRASGDKLDQKSLKRAVAAAYLDGTSATASFTFLRDIGGDRFLDGQRESIETLGKKGILTEAETEAMVEDRLAQFKVLLDRGLLDGDLLQVTMSGDTVTARFIAVGNDTLVNSTRVGPERRRAYLGSYFGPDNDFRDKLVKDALVQAGAIEN